MLTHTNRRDKISHVIKRAINSLALTAIVATLSTQKHLTIQEE